MKTKVSIITNIPSPYRVDFFYYLQTHFKDYEFWIIYMSANEDNRSWHLENNKIVNSIFLSSKTLKYQQKLDVKYLHIPKDMNNKLSNLSPDIIVGMEYNPSILQALVWCKIHKKKFIHWTDGTLNSEKTINWIQKLSRIFIIKNSNAYIASSTKAKEKLRYYGAQENRIFISLLTVDIHKFKCSMYTLEQKKNKIIFVGRLSFGKGLDLLLNALPKLRNDFELHILGDGEGKNTLKKQVVQLGIREKVFFDGFLEHEQLVRAYAESKLFVLPTRQDCFGLVILEALSAGVPVIVSKYADGAYDLVQDGKNGFIVNPYNITELAEKLDYAIEHHQKLRDASLIGLNKFEFSEVAQPFQRALEKVQKKSKKYI